jgi:hypothetical protein
MILISRDLNKMLVSLDAPNEKIKKHLRENITDAASDCVYEKIHNAV